MTGARPRSDIEARLAVASLSKMTPSRAGWLLGAGEAVAAVERLRRGLIDPRPEPAPLGLTSGHLRSWGAELRSMDLAAIVARHRELGIGLLGPGDPLWPFTDEPYPPVLIFHVGQLDLLAEPATVGIVGTRRCTTVGRTVAFGLGHDMADRGVAVVSGLALGVDGAAHRGALKGDGTPIGVVASGLDVVYPGGNRVLWGEVAERGVLISESPAGTRPDRWRFPARNRLIAALSRGVVIVESHYRGGSLLTADEAIDRGRPVFSVPGSVTSPASDGTNQLLIDGATPARDAADILETLGLGTAAPPRHASGQSIGGDSPGHASSLEAVILAEIETGPTHVDRLVLACGVDTPEVLDVVQALVARGRISIDGSTVARKDESR